MMQRLFWEKQSLITAQTVKLGSKDQRLSPALSNRSGRLRGTRNADRFATIVAKKHIVVGTRSRKPRSTPPRPTNSDWRRARCTCLIHVGKISSSLELMS